MKSLGVTIAVLTLALAGPAAGKNNKDGSGTKSATTSNAARSHTVKGEHIKDGVITTRRSSRQTNGKDLPNPCWPILCPTDPIRK